MVLGNKGNDWHGVAKIGGAFDLEATCCANCRKKYLNALIGFLTQNHPRKPQSSQWGINITSPQSSEPRLCALCAAFAPSVVKIPAQAWPTVFTKTPTKKASAFTKGMSSKENRPPINFLLLFRTLNYA